MAAFIPVKAEVKEKIYQLRISAELFDKLDRESERQDVPKQELIRQMIEHCLQEIKPAYDLNRRRKKA